MIIHLVGGAEALEEAHAGGGGQRRERLCALRSLPHRHQDLELVVAAEPVTVVWGKEFRWRATCFSGGVRHRREIMVEHEVALLLLLLLLLEWRR